MITFHGTVIPHQILNVTGAKPVADLVGIRVTALLDVAYVLRIVRCMTRVFDSSQNCSDVTPLTIRLLQDEYLEAAPDAEGGPEPAATGTGMGRQIRHVSDTTTAIAEAQPALPVSEASTQLQADHLAAKGPGAAKARPRVPARPRAAKAAEQANLKPGVQQQQQMQGQQQKASDNSETRYLRMLQESGVTPEEMEEAY